MPGAEYNVIVRKVFDDEEEGYEFYNNYAKGKDLVSEKTIVSGTLATMRGLFGILFAVSRFPRREGAEEGE